MKTRKRISAMLLAFMMVFSTVGYTPVEAAEHVHDGTCGYKAEVPCGHTTHDDICGYKEATEGSACNHEHDESCYRQVKNCQHIHGDECYGATILDATPSDTPSPDNCTHECIVDSGCITEELDCSHVHDGECGYDAGTDGQPCTHEQGEHDGTCGYEAGQPCIYQDSGTPDGTTSRQDAQKPLGASLLTLGDTCNCETQCVEQAPNADCPVCGPEGADLKKCAVRGVLVHLKYYPEGLAGTGVPYRNYDGELLVKVSTSAVTVEAATYPETIAVVPTSADGTATGPAVTYYRAGIVKMGADGNRKTVGALTIPYYPSTDTTKAGKWITAWGDGLMVAYVPQEPTQPVCNCTTLCGTNQFCPVCKNATAETVADVCAVKVLPVSLTLFPGVVSAGGGIAYNDSTSRTVTVGASGETLFTANAASGYPDTITLEQDVTGSPKKGTYQRAGFLLVDEQGAAQSAGSVAVPAFPSTGDKAKKDAWNKKWGGGLQVAYVWQEPEPTSPPVPGETYWFDLSGTGIPGTVNIDHHIDEAPFPDKTLHWVPFTYTGEINAYKLTDPMATTEEYATEKSYPHSLFIADYNVTHAVSWDDLKGLSESGNLQAVNDWIFGKPYSAGNVEYTLRAPSAGSDAQNTYGQGGIPENNEWDQIPIEYIKNCGSIFSWGQDSYADDSYPWYRTYRGGELVNWFGAISSDERSSEFVGFRPVLEFPTSDNLRVVTVRLAGGKIGNVQGWLNLVVKAGEPFDAPPAEGIRKGNYVLTEWQDNEGNTYSPGDLKSVPDTVYALTAIYGGFTIPSDSDDDDNNNYIAQPIGDKRIQINSGSTPGTVTITGGTNVSATGMTTEEMDGHTEYLQKSGAFDKLLQNYGIEQAKTGASGAFPVPGTGSVRPILGTNIITQPGANGVGIQMEATLNPAAVDNAVDAAMRITIISTEEEMIAALGRLQDVAFNYDLSENAAKRLLDAARYICNAAGRTFPTSYNPDDSVDLEGSLENISIVMDQIANRGNTGNGIIGNLGNGTGNNFTVATGYGVIHILKDDSVEGYFGTPSAGTTGTDANGNSTTTFNLTNVSTNGTVAKAGGSMTITMTPNGTTYKAQLKATSTSPFILCQIQYLALSNPFTDVAGTDWFYPAVMELYSRGIMHGTSATTFTPGGPVTRAQVAQVLYNMDGRPQAAPGGVTSDIPADAWYADAAAWAMGRGIVQVTGDRFGGDDPVSRQELVEMLYRYAKYRGWDVSMGENTNILSYKDFDQIGDEAIAAFQWACGMAIVQGDGNGYLHPQDGLTRAELAQMLQRTLEKYKQPAAPVSLNTGTSKSQRHKVQKGDTLSRLAGKYKTTVAAIVRANPIITDPSFLRVGWELDIP